MRGTRRRVPPKVSADVSRNYDGGGGRDSDASLCSSRPSSVGGGRSSSSAAALLTDRSSQSAALRFINSYLSSESAPFSLKPPLPSARDITETLRFVLSHLDWPLHDLEDDLPSLLKHLGCPIKLNRSALKAPGTPHAWPPLLSVIHWLVQLARYADHLSASPSSDPASNYLLRYAARSYSLFIDGDDDAVAELDDEYLRKAEHQASKTAAEVEMLEKEANDLGQKLQALTSGPSRREALERERALLVEDAKKFQAIVDSWSGKVAAMESALGELEKELEAKERESRRICEENEELKQKIEVQGVNVRDVERMRKELQAVERDIVEAESARNALEEKVWELEATVGRKFQDLEALSEQCNQAIRKLKLGNDFQYVLNPKGSSPAEVMGINYKTTLKPALSGLADDSKKVSVSKLEELIALQQQSGENAKMLEEKRGRLAALQAKIDEAEARLRLLKKEMEDHASRCVAEAEKLKEEVERKEHQLTIVEREAEEFLKSSEQKLQDAIRESDEETQMCARELLALIDMVSEYKEYMESTISGMKADLSETADAVAEAFRASLSSAKLASTGSNLSHCGLKRARNPSAS